MKEIFAPLNSGAGTVEEVVTVERVDFERFDPVANKVTELMICQYVRSGNLCVERHTSLPSLRALIHGAVDVSNSKLKSMFGYPVGAQSHAFFHVLPLSRLR